MTDTRPSRLSPDALLVLAATFTVLVALTAAVAWFAWERWQRYEDFLANIEPRIARLAGVHDARDVIAATLDTARLQTAGYAYPSTTDSARVASELQNRVREVFQRNGMSVAGSQQVPARQAGDHEEIGMVINVQGELPQLVAALGNLRALSPRLRVESLTIRSTPASRARPQDSAQHLSAELRLIANRLTQS